jgi:glycosyltransferase involved in cell wall biosynthesis
MRLALVASHPIQYQAPWFRALAAHTDLDIHVYFCRIATAEDQADAGFGVPFVWDVPLLDGYPYSVLNDAQQWPDGDASGTTGLKRFEPITRGGYDAVVVLGWHDLMFRQAIYASWRAGCPVLIRGDSTLHTERAGWKRAVKWPIYRAALPSLAACLAVGTWSREYFLHYGVRPDKVFHVPHVIDDRFHVEATRLKPQRALLRRHMALNDDHIVFLFAGKFLERKRPMDFVRAIEGTAGQGLPVAGLMVGDGPLRHECEEYAESRSVPIRFAGFQNQTEIVRSYVASDALVLPSDGRETWGLVVNEAIACGLPCIVSDRVGCGPDLIVPGKTGSTFQCGNLEELSDVLGEYGRDHGKVERMRPDVLDLSRTFRPSVAVNGLVEAVRGVTNVRGKCA